MFNIILNYIITKYYIIAEYLFVFIRSLYGFYRI